MSQCLGTERSRVGSNVPENGAATAGPASSGCHPAPGSSFQHAGTRCRPPASQICSVGGNWDLFWLPSCSSAHLHEAGCHMRAARGSTRREINLLPPHTRWGGGGSPAPASTGSTGGCCGRQEKAGAVSSPNTLSIALSSHAWPFIRYNFLLFSHTFLLSCQNAISDLTAEMAELSMLTHTPVSSLLLQLHSVCSTTCQETIKLSLHSQLSASRRAESFKAIYVSIKSNENTTTEKNKRPLFSGKKNQPFPHLSACFLTRNQWPGGMDRSESDPGLVTE